MIISEEKGAADNAQDSSQPHESPGPEASPPEARRDLGQRAVPFDWKNKWLKGDEYYHILMNAEQYASTFAFEKFPPKTHPPSTYTGPEGTSPVCIVDGLIYFVEGLSVGSEFGFPRVGIKKLYKWYPSPF